jgi:hypothetical protein
MAVSACAATMSFMKSRKSTRRRRFLCAAVTAFRLGATVLCTALLVSSRPQAMPLTVLSGLSTAIEQAIAMQKMSYICRHGSQSGRCHHVSRPYLRYGAHPYYQPRRNVGEPPYNPYYWGGPLGNFAKLSELTHALSAFRDVPEAIRILVAISGHKHLRRYVHSW